MPCHPARSTHKSMAEACKYISSWKNASTNACTWIMASSTPCEDQRNSLVKRTAPMPFHEPVETYSVISRVLSIHGNCPCKAPLGCINNVKPLKRYAVVTASPTSCAERFQSSNCPRNALPSSCLVLFPERSV